MNAVVPFHAQTMLKSGVENLQVNGGPAFKIYYYTKIRMKIYRRCRKEMNSGNNIDNLVKVIIMKLISCPTSEVKKVIVHQNVTEQIVSYFKEHIESGDWKVGEKIPSENMLVKTLGVSRASIRQAVSQLAGIGVLESVHGKGTFLIDDQLDENLASENKITAEDCLDVEKVLEFRRIVESEACYLATLHATPELLETLKHYLKIMIESNEDVEQFVTADIGFHQEICKASQNPLLEKSMNKILEENRKSQQLTRKTFGYLDGIHYHELIIQAMEKGDAKKARKCMFDHLQNGINRLHR